MSRRKRRGELDEVSFEIAAAIVDILHEAGERQGAAAEKVGMNQASMSRMLNHRTPGSSAALFRLALGLGFDVSVTIRKASSGQPAFSIEVD